MAEAARAIPSIARDELQRKIDRGDAFVLLETLSPEHFRHAHLPRARNAPPAQLEELAPVLIPDKDSEVVTYCVGPSCHASDGCGACAAIGYTNVRYYPGGKQDWRTAGLPVNVGCSYRLPVCTD